MIIKIKPGKGCFSSTYNIDITSNCPGKCDYCYAGYTNKKKLANLDINGTRVNTISEDKTTKELKDISNGILRFGKSADPCYPPALDTLSNLLKLCSKNDVRPVVITKMPPRSLEYISLVTKANGIFHITYGYDSLEQNVVDLGFSNKVRIDRAMLYKSCGYNPVVRVLTDITKPPPDIVKEMNALDIRVIATPIRFRSDNLARVVAGEDYNKRYSRYKAFYRPNFIDKKFRDIRICGELASGEVHCGKCYLE